MISEAEYQTLLRNQEMARGGVIAEPAKQKRRGVMNKWEAAYAQNLASLQAVGAMAWWGFEPWKLRLADGAWYTPDFALVKVGGRLEFHEVKGFWREAARVRIKVAADKYPFPFYAVTRAKNGEWQYEHIAGRA